MTLASFSRGIPLRNARLFNQIHNKIIMKNLITPPYLTPQVRAIALSTERGFAASLEDPIVPPGGSEGTGEEEW